ncbi:unnamed protein product [Gongylonema pulchrum]|uniref:Late endosomal/lysosomal adaptor and MAPK and MTOR activator 5 n=1 Tax=Gongylonema pulchrum TaxID=637853 RepID=A0A183CXT3_9BILA|nr:unnamed protein product [Gongylonema pulchrum]
MLGLMNSPTECDEFYAERSRDGESTAFPGQHRKKAQVSYRQDGRRMIDGNVEKVKEPGEMWNSLLIKSAARYVDGSNGSITGQCVTDQPEGRVLENDVTVMPKLLDITMRCKPKTTTVIDYLGSTSVVFISESGQDKAEEGNEVQEKSKVGK